MHEKLIRAWVGGGGGGEEDVCERGEGDVCEREDRHKS